MAATRTSKTRAGVRAETAAGAERSGSTIAGAFADHQAALRRLQDEAEEARREATATYRDKVQDATHKAYEPARKAYLAYLSAYQSAAADPGGVATPEVARAEFEYLEAHRKATDDAQRSCETHWQACLDAIRKVDDDLREAWAAAFGDFVGVVQQAAAGWEAATADPAEVLAVGQAVTAAATSALSARAA
jgi:hypothetical protein